MRIGNVEFFSKTEYMAGLRDSGRIELLKQKTDINNPLAAAALFRELKNQPFYFETAVGKEFMKELVRRTNPSDRGLGAGIRREGYRATEKEEERIRAYEQNRNRKLADSIRIIGNDAEKYDRYGEFEYDENEEIPGRRAMRNRSVRNIDYAENYNRSRSYGAVLTEQDSRDDSYAQGNATKSGRTSGSGKKRVKKSSARNKSKRAEVEATKRPVTESAKKRKKEQRRSLLLLAGILSALLLGYCVTDEMSYRIQSFASEKKMEALQNSVLQPMEKASDSEPVMERIAMAGNDSLVLSDSARQTEPVQTENGILPEYADLYEKNDDLVGWIRIPDTRINYPVMQTKEDMEYYLHRDFNGNEDVNGLPFLDARCDVNKPTTNLLIYGHSMNSGAMFASLKDYKDYGFYQKHKKVYFDTVQERGEYEIVAVFQSRVAYVDEVAFRYYNFIQADTKEEFDSFISAVETLAYYDTGVKAEFGDQLLTLSTCDREITDGRLVVLAKKCNKN